MVIVSTCVFYDSLNDRISCVKILFQLPLSSELIVRWASDFYGYQEGGLTTIELVADSDFEVAQFAIQGCPRRIPDSDPTTRLSLEVLGTGRFPGI